MTPPLPLIAITEDTLELVTEELHLSQASALGLIKRLANNTSFFDKDGNLWKSQIKSDTFKPTLLNQLLAKTFYNTKLQVDHTWIQVGVYGLDYLKDKIGYCIDKDDDIITQFVEADFLKEKVERCKDFNQITAILSAYVFYPDEEKIHEEFSVED